MPLQDIKFAPTMMANNTPYSAQGAWRIGDKVRFRNGFPETIGGWQRKTSQTYLGVCRALTAWKTLGGEALIGVGTNLKYYLERGGGYYDITPIRRTITLLNPLQTVASTLAADISASDTTLTLTSAALFPFSGFVKINSEVIQYNNKLGNQLLGLVRGANGTTPAPHTAMTFVGTNSLLITDMAHGAFNNDFVTISGATAVDGILAASINKEFQVTSSSIDTYYVITDTFATSAVTGGGNVTFAYQLNVGLETLVTGVGWGAGGWGVSGWGSAAATGIGTQLRIWNHQNFGEDLIYGPRGQGIYYWDATLGVTAGFLYRGVNLSTLMGASDVPVVQNRLLVTESRFALAFGTNPIGSTVLDPLLIRWSDQELIQDWTPTPTNAAGDLRLAIGSEIIAAVQTRQEILVWTDAALYSLQYNEGVAFTQTLISDNISIAGPNAVIASNNVVYWMGKDKFYVYTGRTDTLASTVDEYVFEDMNIDQGFQVYAGVNESFDEVWWFYPSANSMQNDRYVAFNYTDNGWIVGNLARSAWLGSGLLKYPVAGNDNRLFEHELGVDDGTDNLLVPMASYLESSDFSIASGEAYSFVRRMLPDVDFSRSVAAQPELQLTLKPRVASGAPYRGEGSTPNVTRTASVPVQLYTEQVWVRLRGRQMKMRIEASTLGTAWRVGVPRIDIKPDGRRA